MLEVLGEIDPIFQAVSTVAALISLMITLASAFQKSPSASAGFLGDISANQKVPILILSFIMHLVLLIPVWLIYTIVYCSIVGSVAFTLGFIGSAAWLILSSFNTPEGFPTNITSDAVQFGVGSVVFLLVFVILGCIFVLIQNAVFYARLDHRNPPNEIMLLPRDLSNVLTVFIGSPVTPPFYQPSYYVPPLIGEEDEEEKRAREEETMKESEERLAETEEQMAWTRWISVILWSGIVTILWLLSS